MRTDFSRSGILTVVTGLAAGVLLTPAALAQGYGPYYSPQTPNYGSSTPYGYTPYGYGSSAAVADWTRGGESVTVTAPRYSPWMSNDIGTPYRMHSMSIPVSYSDLNLHTGEGVYTLRQRVKYTARYVCNKLAFRDGSPARLPDSDGCYSHAIDNAVPQTDSAIWNYRS